jgi:hypothetical protein
LPNVFNVQFFTHMEGRMLNRYSWSESKPDPTSQIIPDTL